MIQDQHIDHTASTAGADHLKPQQMLVLQSKAEMGKARPDMQWNEQQECAVW